MAYQVKISNRAKQDLREAVGYIRTGSPDAANLWLNKFNALQKSLARMPARFAVIPEADDVGLPYRDALIFSHRVIYRIDEESSTVFIVRVYHGARRPLIRRDLA